MLPHVCTYMYIYACPVHTGMPHTHIKKENQMIISTYAKKIKSDAIHEIIFGKLEIEVVSLNC